MLLPQLSTMLDSARPLECHAGVFNELLKMIVFAGSISSDRLNFLPHGQKEIQLLCMNSNTDIVLCQFFAELQATRSCLLHEFSSRPSNF